MTANEQVLAAVLRRMTFDELMGFARFVEEQTDSPHDTASIAQVLIGWTESG